MQQIGLKGRGKIWIDAVTGDIFQDDERLTPLPPQEDALLRFFVNHPFVMHTFTALIEVVWADDITEDDDGKKYTIVGKEDLFGLVRKLHHRIEADPSQPSYIVLSKRKPESGYQFYPEGRPE